MFPSIESTTALLQNLSEAYPVEVKSWFVRIASKERSSWFEH
ncbi:hypothetical protein AWB77_01496 [Caballeronia fortuita]|uniref:Uncharacterized protein n=1 Tax=Caballeronia fortuita TaxID=1777138 RepID=A0A158A8G5_9BURK|nr:hypothetical protein AWB77_01496 [Caballeronia fortuita]